VRVSGQIGPEVLPVAPRIGGLAGGDAVGELDECQLGAPARAVGMEEAVDQAIVGIRAEVRSEVGGPVPPGARALDHPEGRQMAQEQLQSDRGDLEFGRELVDGGPGTGDTPQPVG
jgi:hypothetical protein